MLKFCPLYFNLMEFSALLWGLWCVHPIDPYINALRIVTMLVCVNLLSKILTKIATQKRRNLLPLAVMFQSSFPRSFSELLLTLLAVPVLAYVGAGDLLTFLDANCTNYYEITVMRYANVVHSFEGEKSRNNFLERCASRQARYGAASEARNKFAAAYKQYYAYVMLRRITEDDNNYGCAVLGRICDRLEDFNSADYYYSIFEKERAKTIGKNLQNQKVVAAARVRRLLQFVPKHKLLEQYPEMAYVLKDENLPATMYQNATYLCPTNYGSCVLTNSKSYKIPRTIFATARSRVVRPDYSDFSYYEAWKEVSLNDAPLDQQVRPNDADLVSATGHGKPSASEQGLVPREWKNLTQPAPPICASSI